MKKLVKKIKITSKIEVITGMHIGGSSDNVEIGGIDNPVIKLANKENQPYIPGSSLKGKMRCLLEQTAGASQIGEDPEINNLFGITKDEKRNIENRVSKLIVRDANLTEESEKMLRESIYLDMPYTENKWENVIDRLKGTAEHPRQFERVPAGAQFNVEFIINIWDDDNEEELIKLLKKGLTLLENDYIGGSGSRGYGQIKFGSLKQEILSEENDWGQTK